MQVSEIMSREIFSVGPDDSVTKFISLMEKEHIHEAPVIEEGKLLGMVNFDTVIKKGITDPSRQKINSLMQFKPPVIKIGQNVNEAAEILFNAGMRAAPVLDGKKVVGMVSAWDIAEMAAPTKTFRQTRVENVMSVAEVISQDSDIGTARVMMRERNISRLPVVNKDGKLVGILAVHDLLKAVKQPHEKMTWYGMAAEMERVVSLPVSNIMNDRPPTIRKSDTLGDAANAMVKYRCSGLTVTESGVPIGVITIKDLLEVYVAGLQASGIYYHAIGLEGEDEFIVDTVHRMIGDTLQKIASIVNIQFGFAHFKKHEIGGLRTKWSVRIRIMTDKGIFMSKAWAWDARDAIKNALAHLERMFLKWKEERKERFRKGAKLIKGR